MAVTREIHDKRTAENNTRLQRALLKYNIIYISMDLTHYIHISIVFKFQFIISMYLPMEVYETKMQHKIEATVRDVSRKR